MVDWSSSLDSGVNAVIAYYRVHMVEVKVSHSSLRLGVGSRERVSVGIGIRIWARFRVCPEY